jgi:hypothetical protein
MNQWCSKIHQGPCCSGKHMRQPQLSNQQKTATISETD